MKTRVILKDFSPQVLKAMKEQALLGLQAIGQEAEGYAKEDCPVDTGRLRNSLTYVVEDFQSPPNTNKHPQGDEDAKSGDYRKKGKPKDKTLYLGTNVEYAPYMEYGNYHHEVGKKHFLKDAMANHSDHYKEIMRAALDR